MEDNIITKDVRVKFAFMNRTLFLQTCEKHGIEVTELDNFSYRLEGDSLEISQIQNSFSLETINN